MTVTGTVATTGIVTAIGIAGMTGTAGMTAIVAPAPPDSKGMIAMDGGRKGCQTASGISTVRDAECQPHCIPSPSNAFGHGARLS